LPLKAEKTTHSKSAYAWKELSQQLQELKRIGLRFASSGLAAQARSWQNFLIAAQAVPL
jgi:hypothetical protein